MSHLNWILRAATKNEIQDCLILRTTRKKEITRMPKRRETDVI